MSINRLLHMMIVFIGFLSVATIFLIWDSYMDSAAPELGEEARRACLSKNPECEDRDAIFARWGVVKYSQAECCQLHAALLNQLEALITFFNTFGIRWFVDGGTLLGMVRHGGRMVPWDGDVDLVVVIEHEKNKSADWSMTEKASILMSISKCVGNMVPCTEYA